MDPILDVKEALAARSETTSLEELKSRGKKRVKVVRAEHIAAMIEEAVQRTIESSGLIPQDEADELRERSLEQFKSVLRERESELAEAQEQADELTRTLAANRELEQRLVEFEEALEGAHQRVLDLEQELADANANAAPAGASGGLAGASPDMLMKLMEEVATLKAQQGGGGAGGGGGGAGTSGDAAGATGALNDAIANLTSSMNDQLEKMGRKMGISSAVEAGDVDFTNLFKNDAGDTSMESNIDDMEVKTTTGGGIAANLAKLKKLKGGD